MVRQAGLVEHDHVIQALAPNRTNHAFDVGALPRRSRGRQHLLDAQFEQFAMNARRAPEWVLTTLLAIGNTSVRQEFAIYFGLRLPFHVPGFGVSSGQYPEGSSRHRFPHNPEITSHSAAPTFKSGWKIKRFSPAD
jgi:hypothetical protein